MKTALVISAIAAYASAYPLYKQCDSRWGSHKLGTSSNTICKAGCLMSSVAMAIGSQNPLSLDEWLTSHGGFAGGDEFVWTSVAPYGLHYEG